MMEGMGFGVVVGKLREDFMLFARKLCCWSTILMFEIIMKYLTVSLLLKDNE